MLGTALNTIIGIIGIIVGIVSTLATIWLASKKRTITISKRTSLFFSPASKGTFTFDYSSNNGEFVIGEGKSSFRTKWSKANRTSIHAYRDGAEILAIARLKSVEDIEKITKIDGDFSSRCQTPQIGDAIVWQNKAFKYAITKIVEIKDDTRGDSHDELTCEYVIMEV